jgi:hypothetical protein
MKILLFHYIGGAGGKFIANCLSFSKKVAFSNYGIAHSFLNNKDLNFLETHLLNTIPDKDRSREWLQFEQGCHQLFGSSINKIRQNIPVNQDKLNDVSLLGDQWLPLMAHTMAEFNNLKQFFAHDIVFTVLVDGTTEFIDLAIRLKWQSEHHCLDLDIFNKFKNECQSIKFDYRFDDWNPLDISKHAQISQLADQIGCNFDLNLADNYIKKYINFHIR